MDVIKKDLTRESFNDQKIVDAVNKSAARVMVNLTSKDYKEIIDMMIEERQGLAKDNVQISGD